MQRAVPCACNSRLKARGHSSLSLASEWKLYGILSSFLYTNFHALMIASVGDVRSTLTRLVT